MTIIFKCQRCGQKIKKNVPGLHLEHTEKLFELDYKLMHQCYGIKKKTFAVAIPYEIEIK